jgi:hypothetical protein
MINRFRVALPVVALAFLLWAVNANSQNSAGTGNTQPPDSSAATTTAQTGTHRPVKVISVIVQKWSDLNSKTAADAEAVEQTIDQAQTSNDLKITQQALLVARKELEDIKTNSRKSAKDMNLLAEHFRKLTDQMNKVKNEYEKLHTLFNMNSGDSPIISG